MARRAADTLEGDHSVRLDAGNAVYTYDLYACPTTGWKYFYATLPVALFDSDDDEDQKAGLQPRFLIPEKVFEMYRHFQRHPVLQPSIGRVNQDRILLFDGQHKVAALLWNGRRDFECKIYLNPDLNLLNETNILAHDKFSQTRFYASIMVVKLGTEFGVDFERYKNLEDGLPKSEAGFMKFLDREKALTKADRNKRFRLYLYNSVLQHRDNKAATQLKFADKNVRLNWRDVTAIVKEIMGYLRPARHVWIMLATSSVQKVSGPNNFKRQNVSQEGFNTFVHPVSPLAACRKRRGQAGPMIAPFAELVRLSQRSIGGALTHE